MSQNQAVLNHIALLDVASLDPQLGPVFERPFVSATIDSMPSGRYLVYVCSVPILKFAFDRRHRRCFCRKKFFMVTVGTRLLSPNQCHDC